MMKWRFLPLILFLCVGLFLLRGLALNPRQLPSTKIGKPLPEFRLPELNSSQSISFQKLKGEWSLLNVWASWCANCQEEHEFLMKLAQQNIPIYGLNYKDQVKDARDALKYWGNPYRSTLIDLQGQLSRELGVYGAPETFLIDPAGIIRYRYTGPLNATVWSHNFEPIIQKG